MNFSLIKNLRIRELTVREASEELLDNGPDGLWTMVEG